MQQQQQQQQAQQMQQMQQQQQHMSQYGGGMPGAMPGAYYQPPYSRQVRAVCVCAHASLATCSCPHRCSRHQRMAWDSRKWHHRRIFNNQTIVHKVVVHVPRVHIVFDFSFSPTNTNDL
jgi:hypothetical protein